MSDGPGCCAPSRGGSRESTAVAPGSRSDAGEGMVRIPGGSYWMGSVDRFAYPEDGEAPVKEVARQRRLPVRPRRVTGRRTE